MSVHQFSAKSISGKDVSLQQYRGKPLLIVNVASECGFTPQYEGLEKLYQQYHSAGLEILGFPCNQFGGQEPGDEKAIQNFCTARFGVTFPLFAKIDVNGAQAHPLYQYLKEQARGVLGSKAIKWNFTKFLVDGNGKVLKRFGSTTKPEKLESSIKKLLKK